MLSSLIEQQNIWWKTGKLSRDLFSRAILPELIGSLQSHKIIALVGSRQVGKTSLLYLLIQNLLQNGVTPTDILYFNLDDIGLRPLFASPNDFLQYLRAGEQEKYVFIDEIQRLENPGLFLKALYDLGLKVTFIVSGSSQLELRAKLKEFLVGRIRQFEIERLSYAELQGLFPNRPARDLLHHLMVYGGYPEVVVSESVEEKKNVLRGIVQTYLQKDVSDFAKVENIDAFNKLLVLLAAQTGDLLNVHGLSKTLKISVAVVDRYLDILEGTFIIKRLRPFFRNYKRELSKMPKIYFLDLGLRNALLEQWLPLDVRPDIGKIFENFVYLELRAEDPHQARRYSFWRTTNQTEIDFILEEGQSLEAIEAKFSSTALPKSFASFQEHYPHAKCRVKTFESFL